MPMLMSPQANCPKSRSRILSKKSAATSAIAQAAAA